MAPVEDHPERLGPYRLLGILGEGGMGTVYLGEQEEPIRRQVAIKVIRSAFLSREDRLRFAAECQAMARLSHPNIADIHEAATTAEGHPYFVMGLISGEPITDYCDRHELSIEDRLELFRSVCEGVHYAHQKGIIHRDLKPSNILVSEAEGRPQPKIIDFGIAKALDQPLVEETLVTGQRLVGTPAYMSPETLTELGQSGAEVDTRSDVYSLGVLLYELLSGLSPFDQAKGTKLAQLLSLIDTDVPGPSTRLAQVAPDTRFELARCRRSNPMNHRRRLSGDLDWIALKAMAREPGSRYGSASDLAADIGRHLGNQPVHACPPSTFYRLRKLIRRRRGAVIAAGLLLAALLAGLIGRTIEAQRANQQARAAEQARAEAEQVTAFLVDLFEVSDPGETLGSTITAREILDKGAEKIAAELEDQPLTRARLMATIGTVYKKLGLYSSAEPLLREALELRESELGSDHATVAAAAHELAALRLLQGDYEEVESLLGRALDIQTRALGSDHLETAGTRQRLARLMMRQGRYREAEPLLESTLAIREKAFGTEHRDVAACIMDLAILAWFEGRYADAEPLFLRTLEIQGKLLGPDHPDLAHGLNNLAVLYKNLGRFEDAVPLYERSLAIRENALGPDHPDVAATLNNLANLQDDLGRLDEAEVLHLRALEIWQNTHGPEHPDVALSLGNLASLYESQGRLAEAETASRRSVEIWEQAVGPDHPEVASSLASLADLLAGQQRFMEAESLQLRALAIWQKTLDEGHPDVAWALHGLGTIYLGLERFDDAESYLLKALAVRENALPPGHPDLRATCSELARLMRDIGRVDEARAYEEQCGASTSAKAHQDGG